MNRCIPTTARETAAIMEHKDAIRFAGLEYGLHQIRESDVSNEVKGITVQDIYRDRVTAAIDSGGDMNYHAVY